MLLNMARNFSLCLGLLALSAAATATAAAVADTPTAVDILFERKHLSNLSGGEKLVYRFQRAVSDPKSLGEPFSDDVDLTIRKAEDDGRRDVVLQVFHGDRARPTQDLPDMTGNPILVFFLDRAVNNMTQVASGNRNYFKGKFRDALREKAKIEPLQIDFEGKKVDAFKVTVLPYEGDPNALRMLGYEGSKFSFVVSNAVPGQFVEFSAHFESPVPDSPKLDEQLTLAKVEKAN